MPSHINLVAPLRPAWPSCRRDLRGRIGMDEIDDAPPRGLLLVVPQSGAARRDAGVAGDAGHLGEDQSGAADGARAVMHQMKIAGHALLRRIHAHRRHHGAVGQFHLAQFQRLEHRRHRLLDIDVEAPGAHLPRKRLVDFGDEIRRAQREIVIGDRLGPGHDAEGELHGIEIPEAVDMLEPDQRHVGGVLGLLDFLAAALLHIAARRRRRSARAAWRRPAQSRLPSQAWCRSRSRNARSPWHRRAAPCCP